MIIETLLTTAVPALIPALGDAIRGGVAKLTGSAGAKPQNVDEQISLMQADTDRLRAIAELDKPHGNISQWVADLRASSRYLLAFGAWGHYAILTVLPDIEAGVLQNAFNFAQSVSFFITGDRVYQYLKHGKN